MQMSPADMCDGDNLVVLLASALVCILQAAAAVTGGGSMYQIDLGVLN